MLSVEEALKELPQSEEALRGHNVPSSTTRDPRLRPGGRLQGVRVLAVEDHEDSLELLCTLLSHAGAIVTPTDCVARALAEPGPFDVVVSDIGMPGADGYDLIRQIRARPVGGNIPAIAVTAFSGAEERIRIHNAGFQALVGKPYNPQHLLGVVEGMTK